jgi:hypothetical protein
MKILMLVGLIGLAVVAQGQGEERPGRYAADCKTIYRHEFG